MDKLTSKSLGKLKDKIKNKAAEDSKWQSGPAPTKSRIAGYTEEKDRERMELEMIPDSYLHVSFSSHRNLERPDYQFIRIGYMVSMHVPAEEIDDAYDVAIRMVDELLAREVATINKKKRDIDHGLDSMVAGLSVLGLVLSIEYGMTVKVERDSNSRVKFDIGRSMHVFEDTVEKVVKELQDWTGARAGKEVKRVVNREIEDLGF